MKKYKKVKKTIINTILLVGAFALLSSAFSTIWAITLPVPDFETFFVKQIAEQSTKIYDRTGQVLLYDVRGVRRTPVSFGEIPDIMKKATLAIEDDTFYEHKGIRPDAIARAFFVNLVSGDVKQGGSTITQQVVKNSLLTRDKTITRKIKEVVLSVKLEKSMTKDEILNIYLNQSPYGGNIYGVQEAARAYYKKDISQISLAEAAYLAAIPQAPNYYSPYGKNQLALEKRKNLVLERMLGVGFITKAQYEQAKKERVVFYEKINQGIKAPHFSLWLESILAERYGQENIENNNFKVISTIDWEIQQRVEEIAQKFGAQNEKSFNAKNNAVVVINPKTGEILAFTGSRDYFNKEIDGNFNVATAYRQPGSSFKPFVYATAFNKGYTDLTTVFDLKTEFSTNCSPTSKPLTAGAKCYSPQNYDNKFLGPITLRNALAQSRNVPAVKILYLAGIDDSLETAKKMGITSLKDKKRYGLTLVLGGGEVSLLEMTSAYGVFANDGIKQKTTGILKVTGPNNQTLEEYKTADGERVLTENTARLINDILSDDEARAPAYGRRSLQYFPGRQVAVKTGTTNDYRDVWVIGYTPNIVVGTWSGNNDNTSMQKKVAGQILVPMWNSIMKELLAKTPDERFILPVVNYSGLKPVLRGSWQGGVSQNINGQEVLAVDVHSILYWVDKNNPLGPSPSNPANDAQFNLWEYPIRQWAKTKGYLSGQINIRQPDTLEKQLSNQIVWLSPDEEKTYKKAEDIRVSLSLPSSLNITQVEYYIDNNLIGTNSRSPYDLTLNSEELNLAGNKKYEIKALIKTTTGQTIEKMTNFTLGQ